MQVFFEYLNTLNIVGHFLLFLIENVAIAIAAILIGFPLDGLLKEMKSLITVKRNVLSLFNQFFSIRLLR